jgi:predicted Zn-dependent peptidase
MNKIEKNIFETIKNEKTGAEYTKITHTSGLTILVWKMEGFSTTEALFGTKYGSINTRFKTWKDADFTAVPEGIAHFLEHKLFENEDCDVFEQFAKIGSQANAFTTFDKTCYLFSCADNYLQSLEILLDFVQDPHFTDENIAKEQGIIAQEIKMTNDNPSWVVFFNLLKAMYYEHPVRIDIAGTTDSILKIDKDLLYKCYNTFYNLPNMVLAIAGNVDAEDIAKIADEHLKPTSDLEVESEFLPEPETVVKKEVVTALPVGLPLFQIGYKCVPRVGLENLKAELTANIVTNILSSDTSPLYQRLLDMGLINATFGCEVFNGDGFFSVIFSGESSNPSAVYDELNKEIEKLKSDGLDSEIFDIEKKVIYGSIIKAYNNVEAVAMSLIETYFAGVNPFDTVDVLSSLTIADANAFLNEIDISNSAISVVNPI